MHVKIFFASENDNKFKEYQALFTSLMSSENDDTYELIRWNPSMEVEEIQSLDRNKIVIKKLHDVFDHLQIDYHLNKLSLFLHPDEQYWLMVEDTSFGIDNMNGFPGPLVKFYLNSVPNWKICSMNMKSKAQSIVSIGIGRILYSKERNVIYLGYQTCLEGVINGRIADQPQGTNGFGFDPIFIPDLNNKPGKTYAEMNMEEKNQLNARALVIQGFMNYITTHKQMINY